MNIVLEPYKMNSVAFKLREESEDYYLFYLCMYRTGYTGARLLSLKSKDLEDFINEVGDFLGTVLIDELRVHNLHKNPEDALFCNKYSAAPLPRRTIEYWINLTAKELLNIDNFGFKTVTKTFYYEYFRNNNYNFNKVKRLFSSRRQYMADIDTFLDYCGLTVEEYQLERSRTMSSNANDYLSNIKQVIDKLFALSTTTLSANQKNNLAEVTKDILVMLEPFDNL